MFPQQHYAVSRFFFKTPYFIIIHLTFITVTHYKMYVHLIHFRGCIFPHPSTSFVIMPSVGARMPGFTAPRLSDLRGLFRKERAQRALSAVAATQLGTVSVRLAQRDTAPCCSASSRMQVRSVQSDADAAACRAEKPDRFSSLAVHLGPASSSTK